VNLPRASGSGREQILQVDPAANIVLVTEPSAASSQPAAAARLFRPVDVPAETISPAGDRPVRHRLSAKWRAEQQVRSLNATWRPGPPAHRELQRSNEMLRRRSTGRRVQQELQHSLDQLRKIIGGTVMAIAMTVEKRDPYTSGHQQRVASCRAPSERKWSCGRQSRLTIASAIHDIGKISLRRRSEQALAVEQHGDEPDSGHSQAGYNPQERRFPLAGANIVLQHTSG